MKFSIGSFQINFGKKQSINNAVKAYYDDDRYGYARTNSQIVYQPFDGEKNAGELGIIREYYPDYYNMAARSWQAYMESEIAQIVINNYLMYVIGDGLKLQAQINSDVLIQEGYNNLNASFNSDVESRFKVYSNSKKSDFKEQKNLHFLAKIALKHAKVGGDCLVILRNEGEFVNVQIIDGQHISTPFGTNSENIIRHGIELDNKGKHKAYYVQTDSLSWQRVEAYGNETGRLQAFLIYGSEYRVDNMRGLPILSCVLETISKIDRYKEATVGSAEERQKIAYYIYHGVNSTGENPLLNAKESLGKSTDNKDTDELLKKAKQAIAMTVNKQAINMTNDSDLRMLESKNELYFKDFYDTNFIYLCAALMIPPEVALNKYDSNYSASRAAIKSWENRIKIERHDIGFNYYQNIYNVWLELQVLGNKINAPGYIKALLGSNNMAVEAYQSARWVGRNLPHIDPLKEVMAVRKALGDETTPLTTYEFASEFLNFGDWETIIEQVKKEREFAGIEEQQEAKKDIETDENN